MSVNEWKKFQTGITYYEHESRKRTKGSKYPDRMWRFRFKFQNKVYSSNLGWESHGMSETVVLELWSKYARNRTLGTPPFSPAEEMELAEAAQVQKEQDARTAECRKMDTLFEAVLRDKLAAAGVKSEYETTARGRYEIWIRPRLGDMDIADVTKENILTVLEDLRSGVPYSEAASERVTRKGPKSAQTQKHVLALLGIMWRHAHEQGYVEGDFPGAKIKMRFENARQFFFSEEQIKAVLADLRGDDSDSKKLKGGSGGRGSIDSYGMALLSIHCGLRAGEILSMTWGDAVENRVYDTKNKGQSRRFFPTKAVLEMLDERRALSPFTKPTDYVFSKEDGGMLSEVPSTFKRCFVRLGINEKGEKNPAKKAVFHSFRHTYATHHAMRGTDMRTLAGYLGHSVVRTTERYAHFSPDAAERALQNIEGFGI